MEKRRLQHDSGAALHFASETGISEDKDVPRDGGDASVNLGGTLNEELGTQRCRLEKGRAVEPFARSSGGEFRQRKMMLHTGSNIGTYRASILGEGRP